MLKSDESLTVSSPMPGEEDEEPTTREYLAAFVETARKIRFDADCLWQELEEFARSLGVKL